VEDQLAVTVAAGRRSHRARSSETPEGVCRRRRRLRANGFAEGNVQVVAFSTVIDFELSVDGGVLENIVSPENAPRESARLTLTAPDPRTHAQTWPKTKKRPARPSSRQPPTKRSPRRTGATTRRTRISRPPDSPFPEASSSPPHLFPQGVPLPQEPQRRQGRRRRQQPGVRPRVQLHARLPRRLPQPLVDVDQEDRGALSREGPKTLVSRAGERRTLARA
jgi:hypothetical protein